MKKNFNIVMINFDKSAAPEKELLAAAIAVSNSGGGVIFAEGSSLCENGLSFYAVEYISKMTIPPIYTAIDILFPKTNWKIHIPPANSPVSSIYGDAYALDRNLMPNKIYPTILSFPKTALKNVISENPLEIFDEKLSETAAKKLGRTRKYRGIENFNLSVFYKTVSAFEYGKDGGFPTFQGLLFFGKESEIKRLLPFSGAVYTFYGAKRERIRKISFSGKALFSQKYALCYEIMKDSVNCRRASSFIFAFSNALFTAFSLKDNRKMNVIKIHNRNGVIEISFPAVIKDISDGKLEKEALKTELGKTLNIFGKPFFGKGAFKTAKKLMISEGFSPCKILPGKSSVKIILDFKHKVP